MSQDVQNNPETVAIEYLETLGLSAYAARTFVALVSLGGGTARDVSETADVPRTRVYDAVEELDTHGLVERQHSNPNRFWPASVETISRYFEERYQSRVAVLGEALDELDSTSRPSEQRGVWTVTGTERVTDRTVEFVDAAGDTVTYLAGPDQRSPDITAALERATDRGVAVNVAEAPTNGAPGPQDTADAGVSTPEWGAPTGRLLLVDGETALVGARLAVDSETTTEIAVWATGASNSLVTVLCALFT